MSSLKRMYWSMLLLAILRRKDYHSSQYFTLLKMLVKLSGQGVINKIGGN
jgi:hypothetical protein